MVLAIFFTLYFFTGCWIPIWYPDFNSHFLKLDPPRLLFAAFLACFDWFFNCTIHRIFSILGAGCF
ncbi:MAG: hypothetical protein CVU41_13270 [Chloroflexi bacterium HGW-Chloroflexi-3]|nr:MAG: hypothetical protein CVU41_13270 [Chloroflexi bacterium HGW-Chloroflexi-3]